MGFWSTTGDIAVALGKGVYSVGEDIVYGADRTFEGLGVSGSSRILQIGIENEYLLEHVKNVAKFGLSETSPIYDMITTILVEYFDRLPEELVQKLASKAAVGGAYVGGRMVVGKWLAKKIAIRIATAVASSTLYKQFAKKIGVSAAAGSTGIGIPITLLMLQGVGQRASYASGRLRANHPELWGKLRAKRGMDMLYFLVEGPMAKHLELIKAAKQNSLQWQLHVKNLKSELER